MAVKNRGIPEGIVVELVIIDKESTDYTDHGHTRKLVALHDVLGRGLQKIGILMRFWKILNPKILKIRKKKFLFLFFQIYNFRDSES